VKVGIALNMLEKPGRSDAAVFAEHMALGAKTYAKMKDENYRKKATEFYVKIQVTGTPDDCIQQVAELRRLTGLDHLVSEFAFGGMPHEEAELNMRLFADRVVPVLQRDPAFTRVETPIGAGAPASAPDVFAPA
jgi:alkanesulfonate monooxygenase SsuD/methylene tetrahydromethanopterin reductase-like flavin-dependent oxidoreductase (luciferase family)